MLAVTCNLSKSVLLLLLECSGAVDCWFSSLVLRNPGGDVTARLLTYILLWEQEIS